MDIFEGLWLREVIDNDSSNGSSIVGIGNGSESLLSSCVPNLIFDGFVFEMNGLGGELDPNGGFRIHGKGVLNKAGEEISLSNARVSNHDYFVEEIELLLSWHCSDFIP